MEKKMERNPERFAYFVLLQPRKARYGAGPYTDPETGMPSFVAFAKDPKTGDYVPRKYKFNSAQRTVRVPINQKDLQGKSVVEWLKNHPECAGSPNTNGSIWFKYIDEEGDAEQSVKALQRRNEAENIALNLSDVEVEEMAAIYGQRGNNKLFKLTQIASSDPEDFISTYNSSSRRALAVAKKALELDIVKLDGVVYKWEDHSLGTTLSDIVKALIDNGELQYSIEKLLGDFGGGISEKVVKIKEEEIAQIDQVDISEVPEGAEIVDTVEIVPEAPKTALEAANEDLGISKED